MVKSNETHVSLQNLQNSTQTFHAAGSAELMTLPPSHQTSDSHLEFQFRLSSLLLPLLLLLQKTATFGSSKGGRSRQALIRFPHPCHEELGIFLREPLWLLTPLVKLPAFLRF